MPAKPTQNSVGTIKVPAILGSLLLLLGVGLGVFLVQQQLRPDVGAQPEIQPRQMQISNLTDNSFVVSWTTQDAATGVVSYGNTQDTTFIARDKRDVFNQQLSEYTTHWVELVNLEPETTYYFYIQSEGKRFDSEGQLYSVTTGPRLAAVPASAGTGQITTADGQAATNTVVIVNNPEIGAMSALTDDSGTWNINFAATRNADGTATVNITELDQLTLTVQGGIQGSSTARLSPSQLSPAPSIQLGGNYDFIDLATDSTNPGEDSPSQFSFVTDLGAQDAASETEITIWNPQEGEPLSTDTPLFIGLAPAGEEITITIDPSTENIEGTTMADERGNWTFASPQALTVGDHAVIASYTDDQGVEFQSSRLFTVLANGNSPAIESSPSATTGSPTPTTPPATPTQIAVANTPTPTTAVVPPTATPTTTQAATTTITPSVTVTIAPTATPTQVQETPSTPTPTPSTLPDAGATLPTMVVSGVGLILIAFSVLFLL